MGTVDRSVIRPKSARRPIVRIDALVTRWGQISLANRFLICAALVVCLTMASTATWMDIQLKKSVVLNAALSSARIMETVITPLVQDLTEQRAVSPSSGQTIEAFVKQASLGRRIVQVKIWMPDGTLVYTLDRSRVGELHPLSEDVSGALNGRVIGHFDDIGDTEAVEERKLGIPLFEIYAPLQERGTGRIIAVGEFYEDATALGQEFELAQRQSWLVVGHLTIFMLALLFSIVNRGSRLIAAQQTMLQTRIEEQRHLIEQNEMLQNRIRLAHQNETAITERFLRRVGAELHDGPAQLLTMVLMRLHELIPKPGWDAGRSPPRPGDNPFEAVESAAKEALTEIRNVATGLSLPHLENRNAAEVLRLVITNHELRTGSEVRSYFGTLPRSLSLAQKICLFRCVQEGLSNAYRHAGAKGQFVSLEAVDNRLVLTVKDEGPGFSPAIHQDQRHTLGLDGLRHRVEALEGEFELHSAPNHGTTIRISLPQASLP